MTMGDEALFSAMAFPVIVGPILEKVRCQEKFNITSTFAVQLAVN